MSLPHLHLYHPAHTVHGSILAWIADVEEVLRSEAAWRMCQLSRVAYTDQGSFQLGRKLIVCVECQGLLYSFRMFSEPHSSALGAYLVASLLFTRSCRRHQPISLKPAKKRVEDTKTANLAFRFANSSHI